MPLVVAGATEEKLEGGPPGLVGIGINLRSGRPYPRPLRAALRGVLHQPRHRTETQRMRQRIADLRDPVTTIAGTIEAAIAFRRLVHAIAEPKLLRSAPRS